MPEPIYLLINDMHVERENLDAFRNNWNEALEICRKYRIYDIVVGGDFFQSRAAQVLSTLRAGHDALDLAAKNFIHVYLLPGNHDLVDQEAEVSYMHVYEDHPSVSVTPFFISKLKDGKAFAAMRYWPEDGSLKQHLDDLTMYLDHLGYRKEDVILYVHQGIRGGLEAPTKKECPASWFKGFRKVLAGHYHDRKEIDNILYIGASRQHNYGEDEAKGYTILYDNGDTLFIQNRTNQRYATLQAAPGVLPGALEKCRELADKNYMVKLRLFCTPEERKIVDREAITKAGVAELEIEVSDNVAQAIAKSFANKYDREGIVEEYVTFCDMKAVKNKTLGVEYLNRIKKEEVCGK